MLYFTLAPFVIKCSSPRSRAFLLPGVLNYGHSAIDNATRGLISLGQLPVTCGLFFSLGHSTIVIAVVSASEVHNMPIWLIDM